MDTYLVKVPQLGVNDATAKVVDWLCKDGVKVDRGQEIATLETTKVTMGIEAETKGYLVQLVKKEVELEVGEVFCAIVEKVNQVDKIRLSAVCTVSSN